MAIMIPDSCPSRATVGEKRIFGLLRDALPDSFTAWYEPVVAGRHPDFTLVADDPGAGKTVMAGLRLKEPKAHGPVRHPTARATPQVTPAPPEARVTAVL